MTTAGPADISVLHLVPSRGAPFFESQIRVLRDRGVNCDVLDVSRQFKSGAGWIETAGTGENHTYFDYARFAVSSFYRGFGNYDIIHANHGLTSPFATLQPNLPAVTSLWGNEANGKYSSIVRFCARRSVETIVMSDAMAADLSHDVRVIPHGVDLDLFEPAPQVDARRHVGWSDDAWHALFPYAPSRPVKNYPLARTVVEAARTKLDRPLELHSVYDVPHQEIPAYMNAADVLLLTSNHEGSPNAVKEAMACNLPVVATDVGDVAERLNSVTPSRVCRNKQELVDSVVAILQSGERSNGRSAAAEVSLEAMGDTLLEVYETIALG